MIKWAWSYLDTDLRLIVGSKSSCEVLSLSYLAFGDVDEHRVRLKHFINVFFPEVGVGFTPVMAHDSTQRLRDLHFAPPRNDLVLVASNLEALSAAFQADNCDIGEPYLIGWSEYRHD